MKKFLCALLLAALLCGLFAQAAGAEDYNEGDSLPSFEGARTFARWLESLRSGEDLGALLYVHVLEAGPYEWQSADGESQIVGDSGEHYLMRARFEVWRCRYGSFEERELSLFAYQAIDSLLPGQTYVIRVKNQAPTFPAVPRDTVLPDDLGDWTLYEILPVIDSTVFVPTGFFCDLPLYLEAKLQEAPTALITGNRVNVRAGAGASYRSLGKVNEGDVVVLLGTEGRWVHILYDGMKGYVWDAYVSYS